MKLLLVDDNDAVREGLRQAIALKTTFEVVGEARDGAEAIRMVGELDVDIVLMDVMMPNIDGIQATQVIKKAHPNVYIIGLSASDEPTAVSGMLRAGASGFILKGTLPAEFLSPLEAIVTGHRIQSIEPLVL